MQRRHRQGFTLIELLVVIGVILILIGLGFGAYVETMRHAAAQRTAVAMETGKSLYDNYRAADPKMTVLNALLGGSVPNLLDTALSGKTLLNSQADLAGGTLRACKGPHHEHVWQTIETNDDQYQTTLRAIDFTQQVMRILLSVPENRELLNKLPSESRYVISDANGTPIDPPLLADSFGEPVYFVPQGGLVVSGIGPGGTTLIPPYYAHAALSAVTAAVNQNSVWPTVMRSDGKAHVAASDGAPDVTPPANPQPFWASAGPDDDLGAAVPDPTVTKAAQTVPQSGQGGAADDNIYSFGK